MDIIRDWIINIITVMMISFFVEILMPNGGFKKYSKLVLGLIVMIMIIKPIVQLSDSEELLNRMTVETGNYIDKTKVVQQSKMLEEKQTQQIINTYRTKVTEQVAARVEAISGRYDAKVNVNIDTNLDSSGFGSIRDMEILLASGSTKGSVPAIASIKPVNISADDNKNENSEDTQNHAIRDGEINKEEEQLKLKILDNLEAVYNIPRDNIKIHLQKNVK